MTADALDHPVLVFIAGPQAGQRVGLTSSLAVLGRGAGVDVMLSEDFASRHQARYELINAGPTLENLSARGTWINGRLFKAGKKVLLETGDLIGVGAETEILFVAAGDDIDAAVAALKASGPMTAFGRKHKTPQPEAAPEPVQPEAPAEAPQEPEAIEEEARPKGEPQRAASAVSAADLAAEEEAAKRKKLYIGLAIYVVVGLAAVGLLVTMTGENDDGLGEGKVVELTGDQIAEALAKVVPVSAEEENTDVANEKLLEARKLYQQYGLNEMNLYHCLKAFKESLAYRGPQRYFDNDDDKDKYDQVLEALTEAVQRRYKDALVREAMKKWREAEKEFEQLLGIIPDQENAIFKNVAEHRGRVHRFKEAEAKSKKKNRGGDRDMF